MPLLVLAGESNHGEEVIQTLNQQADRLKWEGKYDSAFELLDSALNTSMRIGDDSLIANGFTNLGVISMYRGQYSIALEYLLKGLKIREQLFDSAATADSYNYIASVHHTQSSFEVAEQYYEKSLEIRKQLGNKKQLAILYNNIGSLHEDRGYYGEALWNHERSKSIWESLNDTSWMAVSYRHIGLCHQQQGNYEKALKYFLNSYEFTGKKGTSRYLVTICNTIGELYLELNNGPEARRWCERANNLAEEQNNLIAIQNSCFCLSKIYEGTGDYDKALSFYRSSILARDSIFGHERTKELTKLEMSFNFEKEQLADSLQFAAESELQEERIQRQRIGLMSTGAVTLMILALAFAIYRGKRRSDHLLLNILPAEVAEELKEHGSTRAKRLEHATVLFTDFKGFTELSTKLSPEQLVDEIHQCFSAFDEIVGKHRIEKIKTIGDAYMAAGGVPTQSESHAEDVVRAALEIQEFMVNMAKEREVKGEPYFEVRIGVNSGPVVAGVVGTKKFQYDIWGDTVNTASRLERSGKVGRVNISESTYDLVNEKFNCEYRGEIEAKGKGKVKMYFVESPS